MMNTTALLEVLCWGEHKIVKVQSLDVWRGLTHSCDRADCVKPDGKGF